jgi:hypothetical protein
MPPNLTQGVEPMQRLRNYAIASVVALLVLPLTALSQTQPATKFVKHKKVMRNRYIVVLQDDVVSDKAPIEVRREAITSIAKRHAETYQGKYDYIYETALKGYAIELPNEAAAIAISELPEVRWVEEDAIGEFGVDVAMPPVSGKSTTALSLATQRRYCLAFLDP